MAVISTCNPSYACSTLMIGSMTYDDNPPLDIKPKLNFLCHAISQWNSHHVKSLKQFLDARSTFEHLVKNRSIYGCYFLEDYAFIMASTNQRQKQWRELFNDLGFLSTREVTDQKKNKDKHIVISVLPAKELVPNILKYAEERKMRLPIGFVEGTLNYLLSKEEAPKVKEPPVKQRKPKPTQSDFEQFLTQQIKIGFGDPHF